MVATLATLKKVPKTNIDLKHHELHHSKLTRKKITLPSYR
jgi:hypothetical protein